MVFYCFISQLSVRNGLTGNPSLLNTLDIAVLVNENRTATGSLMSLFETTILSFSIFTSAGIKFLSLPAIKNSVGFPSPFTRKPLGALSKYRLTFPLLTSILLYNGFLYTGAGIFLP